MTREKIVIIDFGSQFTQLIARKVRELGAYSEIINFNKIKSLKKNNNSVRILQNFPDGSSAETGDIRFRTFFPYLSR